MKESSMYQYLFKDAIEQGMQKGKKDSIIYFLRAKFKKIRAIKEE